MKNILISIYSIYAVALFFLLTPFMLVFYLLIGFVPGSDKRRVLMRYRVNNIALMIWGFMTGVRMTCEGREKIQDDKSYIFVGNHVNMLDIAIMGRFVNFYGKVLAKKEIVRVPILGYLFKMLSILVDRDNEESRRKSMDVMSSHLKAGTSIFLMPEGTRNKSPYPLLPFKQGAFRLAIYTQTPVVPFILLHLKELQPVKTWKLYPGHIILRFLDPIAPAGYTENDVDAFTQKVRDTMETVILRDDNYWKKHGKPQV